MVNKLCNKCNKERDIRDFYKKSVVVNIKHDKYDVKICRTKDNKIPPAPQEGCFGNPFYLKDVNNDNERAEVIKKYREYFYKKIEQDQEFKKGESTMRLHCEHCKEETQQTDLGLVRYRICVGYDGGGGEYDDRQLRVYQCDKCKKLNGRK